MRRRSPRGTGVPGRSRPLSMIHRHPWSVPPRIESPYHTAIRNPFPPWDLSFSQIIRSDRFQGKCGTRWRLHRKCGKHPPNAIRQSPLLHPERRPKQSFPVWRQEWTKKLLHNGPQHHPGSGSHADIRVCKRNGIQPRIRWSKRLGDPGPMDAVIDRPDHLPAFSHHYSGFSVRKRYGMRNLRGPHRTCRSNSSRHPTCANTCR